MKLPLRYGRNGLTLEVPDSWDVTVVARRPMPALGDPAGAIAAALAGPVGSGELSAEARGCRTACILVCDVTRPVPNGLILRPVIMRLLDAGIQPKSITVLVATGLHRPNEGDELAAVIGDPWVFEHAVVANHFARRDEDHVMLGTTSQGVPVRLDRRLVEAQVRVAIGLVEPHFVAGWSGGRKLLLPGAAHADTITAFHSARLLTHPGAAPCVLKGNPEHETQTEALRMVGRALAVNVVINDERDMTFACFGGIEESLAAAVAFAEPFVRVRVPRPFAVVLSTSAGYPLDATYYQTVKGIDVGASILEPGGDLFVAAGCEEGLGSADFRAAQERMMRCGPRAFLRDAALLSHSPIDEWQTVILARALARGSIHLFSEGLGSGDLALTGTVPSHDLLKDLGIAVDRAEGRRLAVIPEGPYAAPEVHP